MPEADDALTVSLHQPAPIPLAADFHCDAGELLALVGASGSGKTTLLRAVAGLYRPTAGHIACGGEIWFDAARRLSLPPQRRRVGLVFQDYALFPHLTALGNVMVALDSLPARARRKEAAEWLARVHLSGLEARYPGQLSGGQRQRVALARALARRPRVLLLDEPFSAVDQVTRRRLQRELAMLREAIRIPIVLVTHDLDEAAALADRLCVLHDGRSLQTDTPEALFRRPASLEVARVLDRQNIFSGEVVEEGGERRLAWGPWRLAVAEGLETLPIGARVNWYLPASDAVLQSPLVDSPAAGGQENSVTACVDSAVALGSITAVTLAFAHTEQTLHIDLATHAARRHALSPGDEVEVTLLAAGIHLLP